MSFRRRKDNNHFPEEMPIFAKCHRTGLPFFFSRRHFWGKACGKKWRTLPAAPPMLYHAGVLVSFDCDAIKNPSGNWFRCQFRSEDVCAKVRWHRRPGFDFYFRHRRSLQCSWVDLLFNYPSQCRVISIDKSEKIITEPRVVGRCGRSDAHVSLRA